MSNKWKNFRYANSSNLDITNPNRGSANIIGDWHRESTVSRMRINGVLLKDLAGNYDNFQTEKNVTDFIEAELLKDFRGNRAQKTQALDYLKETLHQGGLMFPVSSALATSLTTKDGELLGTVRDNSLEQKINILTTSKGFKVQELVSVGELMVPGGPLQEFANDEHGVIMGPKEGEDNLIQAQGVIDIDFSLNSNEPTLSVERNQMNINHEALSKHLDNRGLGQIIVDFLKNIVGLNKVQDISPKVKETNADLQQENSPTAPKC